MTWLEKLGIFFLTLGAVKLVYALFLFLVERKPSE